MAAAPRRLLKPRHPRSRRGIGRARAVDDAALRLVVQRNDELRAIVGLAVRRLVRNDERGARQYGLRDAIEHILREGDAVKRRLGDVPAVDRDRGPAQAPVGARHGRNTCVPIGLSGLRIVTGTSMVASNTSPPSGSGLCVLRRT